MAAKVGLSSSKEAEEQIVAMIQEGSIHARISQKDGKLSPIATDIEVNIGESTIKLISTFIWFWFAIISYDLGMVQFDANPEKFDSVKMLSMLENHVNSCISLNNQISQMEEEIILSPSYIKKSSSGVGGGTTAPATPGGARSSEIDDDLVSLGGVGTGGPSGLTSASSSSHHRSAGASSTMGSGVMPCSSSTASSNATVATSNHVNQANVSGSNASSSSNAVSQSSNMNGPA